MMYEIETDENFVVEEETILDYESNQNLDSLSATKTYKIIIPVASFSSDGGDPDGFYKLFGVLNYKKHFNVFFTEQP